MRWSDERYVRLYTRDTIAWRCLPWQARALFPLILRKLDRAGLLPLDGHGAAGVAVIVDLPLEVVEVGLPALLKDGCVREVKGVLVCPNFVEAQEATQSDPQRAREKRARDRDRAGREELLGEPEQLGNFPTSGATVTKRDATVTPGHTASQPVTPGHSVPCLAIPDLAVPAEPGDTRAGARDPRTPTPAPDTAAAGGEESPRRPEESPAGGRGKSDGGAGKSPPPRPFNAGAFEALWVELRRQRPGAAHEWPKLAERIGADAALLEPPRAPEAYACDLIAALPLLAEHKARAGERAPPLSVPGFRGWYEELAAWVARGGPPAAAQARRRGGIDGPAPPRTDAVTTTREEL